MNDSAYLVDFGPGVVRRANAAATSKGITALQPTRLRVAFVTHLHSDHTVGYPDLIFTPWTLGRRVPLEIYGPKGLKAMTQHLLDAYRMDIDTRTNADGNQRTFPDGHRVNANEIGEGVVYTDGNVKVTAFATKHAMESYGYRFDTPDRSIVISGDTNPTQATIDACRGCDVLIHEVHTDAWLAARPEAGGAPPGTFRRFSEKYHTTTEQLAALARQAKPKLLILYHYNSLSPEELQDEMMKHYPNHFVIGRDLDVIDARPDSLLQLVDGITTPLPWQYGFMARAHSKLTTPGRNAGRYTSEDIHRRLFAEPAKPRTLADMKNGIRRHVKRGLSVTSGASKK